MKKPAFLIATLLFISFFTSAQSGSLPPTDKSPMDMSYYPVNYPVLKIQEKVTEPLVARVIYSRPQKAGRTIFGGLVKNGEIWRLGANEATEIEFFKNVRIGGKKINKGRYTMFAIISDAGWTIILNKEHDTWGSFKYDQKKDVVRATATTQKSDQPIESFTMAFEKTLTGCNLVIAWDNIKASLPIIF